MKKDIIALIPAYNEEERIVNTIKAIKKSRYINRIIVVDDGSKDNTAKKSLDNNVEVIKLKHNRGKGSALNYGIKKILNNDGIIVFLDADLEHSAWEADKLIFPILNNQCDVTIARFKSPKIKGGFGLVRSLAKYGVKYFTNVEIDSSLSGQRAFKSEVLRNINYLPNQYGVEVSMTIDILKFGYSIKEVDVEMTHRETGRNIRGFIHRGRQFYQIFFTLLNKGLRW